MKKFWSFIDTRPLTWFHYVVLSVAFVFGMKLLQPFVGTETIQAWVVYILMLGLFDQVIHKVLGVD